MEGRPDLGLHLDCLFLGKGLTFSEPQFPGSEMEIKDPLVVQWLGLYTSTSGGTGQGTKIPHAT